MFSEVPKFQAKDGIQTAKFNISWPKKPSSPFDNLPHFDG